MNLAPFIEWIIEREKIRIKKERGDPSPWTDDPILKQYRFCCVRRSDDRVTRWIVKNISEPYAGHPQLWWMLCAARTINHPPALKELIDRSAWPSREDFRFWDLTDVLEARKARGEQVETGAYMIRAETSRKVHWFSWSKQRYVAEIVLGNLWLNRDRVGPIARTSLEAAHAALIDFRGWGPFMAYQAVVDMTFCPALLANAPDRQTWCAAGPGTLRGLNRLHNRPLAARISQDQAREEIRELYPLLRAEVELDFSDVPNVCCEVDKMLRVKNGEGRPRALYKSQGLLT